VNIIKQQGMLSNACDCPGLLGYAVVVVRMLITVFWAVTPIGLADGYRHFG
jgi:hypothetical protein